MKTFYIPATDQDIKYMQDKIRADFDKLDSSDINFHFYAEELIERAIRMSFKELASEMKGDINIVA